MTWVIKKGPCLVEILFEQIVLWRLLSTCNKPIFGSFLQRQDLRRALFSVRLLLPDPHGYFLPSLCSAGVAFLASSRFLQQLEDCWSPVSWAGCTHVPGGEFKRSGERWGVKDLGRNCCIAALRKTLLASGHCTSRWLDDIRCILWDAWLGNSTSASWEFQQDAWIFWSTPSAFSKAWNPTGWLGASNATSWFFVKKMFLHEVPRKKNMRSSFFFKCILILIFWNSNTCFLSLRGSRWFL